MFYFIGELDNHIRIPDTKNSSEEAYNQAVVGIRRALPANIFLNHNHQCFTQFFLRGNPPTGLHNTNLQNMRYICQQRPAPGTTYYASLHDEGRGIPVYSAYRLYAGNIHFQAQNVNGWIQTPGNVIACTKSQKRLRSERVNRDFKQRQRGRRRERHKVRENPKFPLRMTSRKLANVLRSVPTWV